MQPLKTHVYDAAEQSWVTGKQKGIFKHLNPLKLFYMPKPLKV